MNIPLIKIIKKIDEKNKGNRGITGYFKKSKSHYEYFFIPAPKNTSMS